MCIDMCTDMRTGICVDICREHGVDMCIDICIDMCADMRIDMCADACARACACVRVRVCSYTFEKHKYSATLNKKTNKHSEKNEATGAKRDLRRMKEVGQRYFSTNTTFSASTN